jgi:uncharacterized SAM-binding protein YcdF (DUF218 family)
MDGVSCLSGSVKPLQQPRSFRWLGTLVLSVILFAGGIWLLRVPLLRGAADLWIVSDPVTRANAVAVLGGGLDVRPFAAAELYKQGLVTKILVSQVVESQVVVALGAPGHSELNRMLLLKLGIPEAAIEMFGHANRSTWDEATALKDWANQRGVSRLVIPAEIFFARRVRWIFNREFAGSGVQFKILTLDGPGYTRAEWWKTEAGLIAFQNEILKYLYYRFKY